MLDVILEMRHITKTFSGIKALDDISIKVSRGEIHALVGENGAGKSTLMNVLSGIYPFGSYEGEIYYEDNLCKFHKIRDSEEKGIVIIHQELALVPYLTIGENMFLGNEQGHKFSIDWDKTYFVADTFMEIVGLKANSRTLIKDIGVGQQQLVEIAKALAKEVKLLILDEPTASLNEKDSKKLLDLLLEFKNQGMTSIIISHKLNEISYVADKITVIRDGRNISTLDKKIMKFDEDTIVSGMVGRKISDRFPTRKSNIGDICFEVKNWSVDHPIFDGIKVCDNVNLNLRKGEVVGISGLMGAGRTELAMSIFGKSYGTNIHGQLFMNGKEVFFPTVKAAIDQKLAYVTEDRKGNGLILSNPIYKNTSLAKMDKVSRYNIIDEDLEINFAKISIKEMHTKCAGSDQLVGNLSGGNQQKVLLGKWLFADPDILILDEPTRGIDVGAKYEIYCIINKMVLEGKTVVFISSELPEILGMCDRIYVMNEGKIVGELAKKDASQEVIMSMIVQSGKGI